MPTTPATGVTLHHGDALTVLRDMPDGSVDSVVTDPPYALAFMGREWDTQPSPRTFEAWCEQWATEALRVVRPGGYLASFGGTRTYHRLTCGIEDAGWYITDAIGAGLYAWTHGQGFPKGKSQLKPAWEPITIARKPAAKVQPLGIDACRVGTARDVPSFKSCVGTTATSVARSGGPMTRQNLDPSVGRWPTNLVLAHHPECVEVGTREVKTGTAVQRNRNGAKPASVYGQFGTTTDDQTHGMNGRETIAAFDCHPDCHVRALDEQSGTTTSSSRPRCNTAEAHNRTASMGRSSADWMSGGHDDRGGASRFYPTFRYQAKASRSERPQVDGRGHPTVKPLALMAWLIRLVCPPGGLVLDPFAGSGTTLQAVRDEGMRAVGIEADEHSVRLVHQRFADAAAREPQAEPDLFTAAS